MSRIAASFSSWGKTPWKAEFLLNIILKSSKQSVFLLWDWELSLHFLFFKCGTPLLLDLFALSWTSLFILGGVSAATTVPLAVAAAAAAAAALLAFLWRIPQALQRDCSQIDQSEKDQLNIFIKNWVAIVFMLFRFDFRERVWIKKKKKTGNLSTLGPRGPPLQRGVLVVLQSAQTLIVPLLLLSGEDDGCFCSWWSSDFGVVLFDKSVWSEVIIFLIVLTFEGIHLAESWLWWWVSTLSSFFHIDNLSSQSLFNGPSCGTCIFSCISYTYMQANTNYFP